jgi:hypothetical protein
MPALTADDFVRLVTLYAPETISALTFSPDGSLLAVAAGDKIHLFQIPQQLRPPQLLPPTAPSDPSLG